MKVAFATTFLASDRHAWSGTPYYMSDALKAVTTAVLPVGGLQRQLPPFFKLQQAYAKYILGTRLSPRFNVAVAKRYSCALEKQLATIDYDLVLAPQLNPICYLETKKPIVLWTDALYASLLGFYPGFKAHDPRSVAAGNEMVRAALSRVQYAIFSSDWAARTALEIYGAPKEKIAVVPFGANLICPHDFETLRSMIQKRSRHQVKLLFLGKNWERKGGDIVFRVAAALHAAGVPLEVNFVGCLPPAHLTIPPYIKCHGFISKRHEEGRQKLQQLLYESHFLFVPSRSEAYGIVFCEANAFGLPCLTSYVGGISTIVKDGINGQTFSLDAAPEIYVAYITHLMQHPLQYEALALSAFNEYQTRLNWPQAISSVRRLLHDNF